MADKSFNILAGEYITAQRKKMNMTRKEVADHLSISIDKYREIERGRNIIYLKDAKEISKVLNFTLEDLCDFAENKKVPSHKD